MLFQVITQFPERYTSYLSVGLPSRAYERGLFKIHTIQLRDYADPSRKGRLDEPPYGGGPGMIMQIGPIHKALLALPVQLPVVLFTPRGERMTQKMLRGLYNKHNATQNTIGYTLINGYYEGIDERVALHLCDYQISLGDFILGSGDLASLCFIEGLTRLLPNYTGCAESLIDESHEDDFLEYPQYTRPEVYQEWQVPNVLLSGNHQEIAKWRREQRELMTRSLNKD